MLAVERKALDECGCGHAHHGDDGQECHDGHRHDHSQEHIMHVMTITNI